MGGVPEANILYKINNVLNENRRINFETVSLCGERAAFPSFYTGNASHISTGSHPNFPSCGLSSENTASLVNTYSLKEPGF